MKMEIDDRNNLIQQATDCKIANTGNNLQLGAEILRARRPEGEDHFVKFQMPGIDWRMLR